MTEEHKLDVPNEEPEIKTGDFIFPNHDRYEGEYVVNPVTGDIERHGQGTHRTTSGYVYAGQWRADRMNGAGQLQFPNGATYDGEFVDNRYAGAGRYTWPNGCVYQGPFNGCKLEGEGVFTDDKKQDWVGAFLYTAAPGLKFKLKM